MECSFLPCDYGELTEELVRKARETLSEREETKPGKIQELRTLLKEEPNLHFPEEDDFLLRFLRARKFDVERAASLCKSYFKKQQRCRGIFQDVDFSFVQRLSEANCMGCLPSRDSDDCVVFVFFVGRWDPSLVSIKQLTQAVVFGLLQSIRYPASQIAGCKIIFDFSDLGLRHMTCMDPRWVWHTFDSMENCLPYSYKGCYIVNENFLFPYAWSILRIFMTKKLKDRFHFYGKNVMELHNIFPTAILPEEFGGDAGAFSSKTWAQSLEDFQQYFPTMMQYGYDKL